MSREEWCKVVHESRTKAVQGRPASDDVILAITDLTFRGFGPAEIERQMGDDPSFRGRVPKLRTVKKYAALAKQGPASEPWSLVEAPADELAAIVPVVAAVIEQSEGRVRNVSKREAAVVSRILRAAPKVPPWDAYRLARRIVADPSIERDVTEYLGFEPWTEGGRARYEHAYRERWVRHRLIADPAFAEIQRYETPEEAKTGGPR
jgi:hypothetical protein